MFITYDQSKREWSIKYCRYFAFITIASNLFNYKLSDEELNSFYKYLITRKRPPNLQGGQQSESVKTVMERWNILFPNMKINYKELKLRSKIWYSYIKKGGVSAQIKLTDTFVNDYKDGTMDITNHEGKYLGGHVISLHSDGKDIYLTNTWSWTNIVKIKSLDIQDFFTSEQSFTYIKA